MSFPYPESKRVAEALGQEPLDVRVTWLKHSKTMMIDPFFNEAPNAIELPRRASPQQIRDGTKNLIGNIRKVLCKRMKVIVAIEKREKSAEVNHAG